MTFEEFKLSLLLLGFTPVSITDNAHKWVRNHEYVYVNNEGNMGRSFVNSYKEHVHTDFKSLINALGEVNSEGE
jgi:hypothetical protein